MVGLLVALKLRLLANALRSSTAARTTFIVSNLFACVFAAGVFVLLALFRGSGHAVELTSVIFTLIAFGWVMAPLVSFGLDGTLDPATVALYPLRTRPLAIGLLASSSVGAWPLATLIGVLGVTVGLARGPAGLVVAVAAAFLQVLFCITLARLLTTSMAGLLRSRRGKDLAVFLLIPVFALYEFFTQVVPHAAASGQIKGSEFAGLDSWLRWLPPGMAAHAIRDVSTGNPGWAVGRLALVAAVIVVLGTLWIRALNQALVTADASTSSSRARTRRLPFGRFGLRGAVAARTWLYQRRDPYSFVMWAIVAVIMAAVAARAIIGTQRQPVLLLVAAVVGAAFAGFFHANWAGRTGPPFALEALALTGRRELSAWFAGQNAAVLVIAAPLLTSVSVGLAFAAGHPAYGAYGAAIDLAGLGAALAMGDIFTATLPYPMDKRTGSPARQAAQGYGSSTFLGIAGCLAVTAIAVIPVIWLALATGSFPAAARMPPLLAGAALYGLGLLYVGVQIASDAAERRLPEMCEAAVRSKL